MTFRWFYCKNDRAGDICPSLQEGFFYTNEGRDYHTMFMNAPIALIRFEGGSDFIDSSLDINKEHVGVLDEFLALAKNSFRRTVSAIHYVHIPDTDLVYLRLRFGT